MSQATVSSKFYDEYIANMQIMQNITYFLVEGLYSHLILQVMIVTIVINITTILNIIQCF